MSDGEESPTKKGPKGSQDNEPAKPAAKSLPRDDNGKLIIKFDSRLLRSKSHDDDWRSKKLQQYDKEFEDSSRSRRKPLLGYFANPHSASVGDSFIEPAKVEATLARGGGPQLRGGARTIDHVHRGVFNKFITNAAGDPYMSPGQIRAAWLKAQKAKRVQQGAFAGGKPKTPMITPTFSRPRFLSDVDGDVDPAELKRKIQNARETMQKPATAFNRFKPPQFQTNPPKKGG
jgi:hypothetical protein